MKIYLCKNIYKKIGIGIKLYTILYKRDKFDNPDELKVFFNSLIQKSNEMDLNIAKFRQIIVDTTKLMLVKQLHNKVSN